MSIVKTLDTRLVGGALFAVMTVVGLGFAWNETATRFYISPTANREGIGLAHDITRSGYRFTTKPKPTFAELKNQPAAVDATFHFEERLSISLKAICVTVPGSANEIWREPRTNQQLQAPAKLSPTASEETPVIHLLFHANGPKGFLPHAFQVLAFDTRTGARVGGHSWDTSFFEEQVHDDWALISVPLGIWHDTSLGLAMEWAHGIPRLKPLEQQENGVWSYQSGNLRRANYGAKHLYFAAPRWHVEEEFKSDQLAEVMIDPYSPINSHAMIFEDADDAHVSWFTGSTTDIGGMAEAGYLEFEHPKPLVSVTHIELPKRSWRWLELTALTDMPNPRDIDNLFDVRIPRTTTRDPIQIAARAAEMDVRYPSMWRAVTNDNRWVARYPNGEIDYHVSFEELIERTDFSAKELLQFAPVGIQMQVEGFEVVGKSVEDHWWERTWIWLEEKSPF